MGGLSRICSALASSTWPASAAGPMVAWFRRFRNGDLEATPPPPSTRPRARTVSTPIGRSPACSRMRVRGLRDGAKTLKAVDAHLVRFFAEFGFRFFREVFQRFFCFVPACAFFTFLRARLSISRWPFRPLVGVEFRSRQVGDRSDLWPVSGDPTNLAGSPSAPSAVAGIGPPEGMFCRCRCACATGDRR